MKTLISTIIATLITLSVTAQAYEFKVLASEGKNKLINNNNTKDLYTGAKISSGAKVKVSKNGYIGLIHSSGKTMEIKKAGNYNIDQLSAKIKKKAGKSSEKYAKFVINEMKKKEKDIQGNHEKYMKVTGAVHRGIDDDEIEICLPRQKSLIVPGTNHLTWRNNPKVNKYKVVFTNMFEEVVYKKITQDTTLTFNTADINIPDDNMLIVHVEAINSNIKSENHALEVITDKNKGTVLQQENELNKDLDGETAINYLIKASFYEEQNVFLKANECYRKAVELAPEVGPYKVAYLDFLDKHNKNSFYQEPVAAN